MVKLLANMAIVSMMCAACFGTFGGGIGGFIFQNSSQWFKRGVSIGVVFGAVWALVFGTTVSMFIVPALLLAGALGLLWVVFVKFGPQMFTKSAKGNKINKLLFWCKKK